MNGSKKLRLEPNANLPNSSPLSVSYRANRSILSNTEQVFYKALYQGMGNQFLILIKVRVSDVLKPEEEGIAKQDARAATNRISSKHFDFLLCGRNQYEIIAAIELDDQSNKRVGNAKYDEFLTEACKSAEFPLIRIATKQSYAAQEIKAAVLSGLKEYRMKKAA
ncbi:MAG: DUF2726 domain-containing protein [Gammaproteobacteria bacterium]